MSHLENKHGAFAKELGYIQTTFIKNLVIKVLQIVPDYFFVIPASSTGKYHPSYCLGEGGLVRHTKAAVQIAMDLFNNPLYHGFDQKHRDLMIGALILHDTCKSGLTHSQYSVHDHPMLVRQLILKTMDSLTGEEHEAVTEMTRMIESHMGPWCTARNSRVVLPVPQENDELFVHLCDYLASRKSIEVQL